MKSQARAGRPQVSADDLLGSREHRARDKRLIERERARGGGELLAAGVAKGARQGIVLPPVPEPVAKPATLEAAPVAPAAPRHPQRPPPSPCRGPAPAGNMPDFIANSPRSKGARAAAQEPKIAPDFVLPPFTGDLYPSALDGNRDAIVAASLPCSPKSPPRANACEVRTVQDAHEGRARRRLRAQHHRVRGRGPGRGRGPARRAVRRPRRQLLTKMIEGMHQRADPRREARPRRGVHRQRAQVPPAENRNPLPHEIEACSPYVMRQLEALQPRVICCLGKFAAELLLGMKGTISSMRGKTYRWKGASSS